MKTINVTAIWQSHHTIEVPDDFNGDLFSLDNELMEVSSQNAELYDWDIR